MTFKRQMKNIPAAQDGLNELQEIFTYLNNTKIEIKYYQFAPYIARGLAYYTGPIWEFEILEGGVGSVAGCGRYDNTIGRFVGRKVPATGGSFGIERIVEIIKDRKMYSPKMTPVQVLITLFDKSLLRQYINVTALLRDNNIQTMLYPEEARLDKQFKYADKKGIPYVVIIGPEEAKKKVVKLKNMKTGKQKELTYQNIVNELKD